MHARINALTRPHFWSLLPSTILDWVVIIVSVSPSIDAPKRADPSHECNLEYFMAVRTGLTSFRLVPVSTVPAVQVYIFGSVSPPGWHIILPCGTHHNFGIPGGHNRSRTAQSMESIPPWLKPKSASVWSDKMKRDTCFCIRRVSRLDWENAYVATRS